MRVLTIPNWYKSRYFLDLNFKVQQQIGSDWLQVSISSLEKEKTNNYACNGYSLKSNLLYIYLGLVVDLWNKFRRDTLKVSASLRVDPARLQFLFRSMENSFEIDVRQQSLQLNNVNYQNYSSTNLKTRSSLHHDLSPLFA